MYNHLFLGLDAHTRTCTLSTVNDKGKVVSTRTFDISEQALLHHVKKVPSKTKSLIVEESSLAGWIHRILSPHVDELVVCDPKHNALISCGNKNDVSDSIDLCRLYRLGEYVEVYHGDDDHRIDFKIVVKEYMDIRDDCTRLKSKIKAKYRQAGVMDVAGTKVFSKKHREHYLNLLPTPTRRFALERIYNRLDVAEDERDVVLSKIKELGSGYPEIQQFLRIPGVGIVGASIFSAFIGTPHRFDTKQQLWKYCQLAVRERSSGGKSLGYRCLDRSGSGPLKSVSYISWLNAIKTKNPNEVSLFYEASLQRTNDKNNARFNTQRKILVVMWTIWKNNVKYDPDELYSSPVIPVNAQTT